MDIIARYDEVLCEKAQKHQIVELKIDFTKRMDDLQKFFTRTSKLVES